MTERKREPIAHGKSREAEFNNVLKERGTSTIPADLVDAVADDLVKNNSSSTREKTTQLPLLQLPLL